MEWKDFAYDIGTVCKKLLVFTVMSFYLGSAYPSGGTDLETGRSGKGTPNSISATNPMLAPTMNRDANDLDNIQIHDEEEALKGPLIKVSILLSHSRYLPVGFWQGKESAKTDFFSKPTLSQDDKPRLLEGWLEKKGGKGFGSDWQKR